ncbi:MAG TPA: FG-GAP-like repeat-containing protein [Candidatus Sulfotelmatobacter sp.]
MANNIATADFNGDRFPDIAQWLSGGANGKIGISLGSAHGMLGTTSLVTASTCANNLVEWVATGDVNGDGKADIVATLQDATFAGCQNNTVAVLTGLGTGKFKTAAYYPTGSTAQEGIVYLVDVNGDGKPDVVTENADGTISVLLNKGNGTYSAGTLITGIHAINPSGVYLTFADFNGDGKTDIAVTTNGNVSAVYVLLGNGNGTFGAPIQTVTPYYPITLASADFNKDGKVDLLVTTTANGCTNNDRGYAFLKGNGDGTFTPGSINCLPYQSPSIPVVADFNGDGNLDAVIPYYGSTPAGPVVLQGNGDGTFNSSEIFYSGRSVISAAVADFNRDGMLDVALVDASLFNPSFLTVMFNSTQPVSVSPLTVNYGSVTVAAKKPQTVILTNNQSTTLSITSIRLGGTDPGDFSETSNCGTSRKAGWDCTITVTFKPTVTGVRAATLSIKDAVGTQTVQLNGTGK